MLLARVEEYAERVLRPAALKTDRDGVPEKTVRDLRALGLLEPLGGDDERRVHEILAGACLNTWLVWAQHARVVKLVPRSDILLGVAVSDVRRLPCGHVTAERDGDGWVFDGTVSWVSGWGLNEALVVAGVTGDRTVVTGLVPVGPGLTGTPLALAAAGGSRTARVRLDRVRAESVLDVTPLDEWLRADAAGTADAKPHHFGLARTVLRELAAEPAARQVAETWAPRVERLRQRAYAGGEVAERLRVRVEIGEVLSTLTRALVVVRAGRGLALDDTAQLHARSALFLLVQAQTTAVREAQLGSTQTAGE
ncbi:acyl-CoA dehydrogenase [Paractinoplanes atraurantiacus]|uniref:Acyl-CoA dehydrogenase n=1 Tax=Paractinoplanes atraurantiacus TaxID=1036182 RepID=A0A285K8Y8_9ACTN|nr:acyl-CoA dehydrogenase [Actinoplanes atraurantiacus]SNY69055.1 Acyl-CoA dehydrogenase [Actinoplanes atraurantiacus]